MIEMSEEVKKAAKLFRSTFGYGVPFTMLPATVTTLELIRKIDECIEKGEDDLLKTYHVANKKGILY